MLWRTERSIYDISKPVTKYICSIMEFGRSFWACDLEGTAHVWDTETEKLLISCEVSYRPNIWKVTLQM